MKIKFDSDDDLPLNRTLKPRNIIIVITPVSYKGNKCYPHVFLDECLYKL